MSYSFADSLRTGSGRDVEFYSKNKFEKLVNLVGSIIRMYHDARSPESQIRITFSCFLMVSAFIL